MQIFCGGDAFPIETGRALLFVLFFLLCFFILLLLVFPLGKKKGLPRPNERIKRKSNFDEDGKFSASKVGERRERELSEVALRKKNDLHINPLNFEKNFVIF